MRPTGVHLWVILVLALLLLTAALAQNDQPPRPEPAAPISAFLGAMSVEVELLEQQLTDRKEQTVQGIRFRSGKLKDKPVVLAHSGMGKTNVAMAAALLLEHYRPSRVIFTGIAGGLNPDLAPGDVVIGTKVGYHDYGEWTRDGFHVGPTTDPFTGERNPLFFPADAALLAVAEKATAGLKLEPVKLAKGERVPRVVKGRIVTGDAFVGSSSKQEDLRKEFKADAVEMEGAAVAQVCWQRNVPCLIIRSISDGAGDMARDDVERFEKTAAENSALLVREIVSRLESK